MQGRPAKAPSILKVSWSMSTQCPQFCCYFGGVLFVCFLPISLKFCFAKTPGMKNNVLWFYLFLSWKHNKNSNWSLVRMFQRLCSALCYMPLILSCHCDICAVIITTFTDKGRPWGWQRGDGPYPNFTAARAELGVKLRQSASGAHPPNSRTFRTRWPRGSS